MNNNKTEYLPVIPKTAAATAFVDGSDIRVGDATIFILSFEHCQCVLIPPQQHEISCSTLVNKVVMLLVCHTNEAHLMRGFSSVTLSTNVF